MTNLSSILERAAQRADDEMEDFYAEPLPSVNQRAFDLDAMDELGIETYLKARNSISSYRP